MTEEQYDELCNFISDALNGHYPDNITEGDTLFSGDFEVVEGKSDWVGECNSDPIVTHDEWLEKEAYIEQELLNDPTSYNFKIRQAVRVKNTDYYVIFDGLLLSSTGKYIQGL